MREIILNYRDDYKYRKRDMYKNYSKEQRAKALNNIICPKCKYQNHKEYIEVYGTCHLCGNTLDVNYFKKTLLDKLKENK